MTITTEEAERLAQFHDISKELYSDNPEDSGTCAMHHTSATALRSLAAERDTLRQERDGANALVDRMHKQDVLAIKAWQAAHPGSELTWPSSARLSAWCMGEVASVTSERDALRAEVERLKAGGCARDQSTTQFCAEAVALQAENARLREAVRLAIDAVEFWAAYASPYFQEKHDLAKDLQKLRAALGEKE
jgi:hypothetical protein